MEKFQLSILFKIIGIGSASGLLFHNDLLYIISDSSNYLYEYNIDNQKLDKIALTENPQENIPKRDKPDFESITLTNDHIVVVASGSTLYRNAIILYNPKIKKTKTKSMVPVYSLIKKQLAFTDDELNIEGMVTDDKTVYFFQRGNGIQGKNGIIYDDKSAKVPEYKYIPFDLPKINNVATTFTDAILVDDKIYFLAAAEDTASTYQDGEVLGSIIGVIGLKTMALENTLQISDKHKFEGLTLYKKSAAQIEFLLCEDTDSEISESNIYRLTFAIPQ